MHNLHPLHLHEIRILIATHLDTPSLHACTLINHDWNSSFTPHLYHSLHLTHRSRLELTNTNSTNPSLQHTRHLTINYTFPAWPHPPVVLSRLTSLTINDPSYITFTSDIWSFLAKLIDNSNTFAHVDLCRDHSNPVFWAALARCQTLKTLRLRYSSPYSGILPSLYKVCATVERLDFEGMTMWKDTIAPQQYKAPLLMPLRHLRMREVSWRWKDEQGGWAKDDDVASAMTLPWTWMCSPHLESLSVTMRAKAPERPFRLEVVTSEIRAALAADKAGRNFYSLPDTKGEVDGGGDEFLEQYRGLIPMRKLCMFETISATMQDQDLAFLLDHVEKTMRVLCVPTSQAGPLTAHALTRHYTTLTKVNIRHTNIGSLGVLAIMQNCSQLHSLGATSLLGEDIVASYDKPWACSGLQRLSVDILLDWVELSAYMTQVRGVFQKLGELTQLKFLDLLSREPLAKGFMWPILKCNYGIGYLSGMKKLREIYAQRESYDGVNTQDALWMTRHWPQLKVVGVDGHLDGVDERGAMIFLKVRGIKIPELCKASLEIQ